MSGSVNGVGRSGAGVAGVLEAMPVLSTFTPARRRWQPMLAGAVTRADGHIALTFDDGPDQLSTPHFVDLLARYDCRATFFVLGQWCRPNAGLLREMVAAGHELAVHGWTHRATPLLSGTTLLADLQRTTNTIGEITGQQPRFYRPPYGVMTRRAQRAALACDLQPTLWTTWGRDWERGATTGRVLETVDSRLSSGGTVLLHDTDRTSALGSWRVTLAATEVLLDRWQQSGTRVGTLAEHFTESS